MRKFVLMIAALTFFVSSTAYATETPVPTPSPNVSVNNSANAGASAQASGGNPTAYGGQGGNSTAYGGQGGNATGGSASVGNVTGGNASVRSENANINANTNTFSGTQQTTVRQGDVTNTVTSVGGEGGRGGNAVQDQRQGQQQGQGQSQSVHGSGNSRQEQRNDLNNVGSPRITFEATRPALPAAPIPQHYLSAPTVFQQRGQPANAQAIEFALNYLLQCPPIFGNTEVHEMRERGTSRNTRVIYTPHANYLSYADRAVRPRARVAMIPEQVGQGKCVCLGLLQVEAFAGDASAVSFASVVHDAGMFVRNELRGFEEIRLILIPAHSVSVNIGMGSHGNGIGVAPGFSGMLSSILATFGLNASINNGRTFPEAQVGATFALVATGAVPEGALALDISAFHNALRR